MNLLVVYWTNQKCSNFVAGDCLRAQYGHRLSFERGILVSDSPLGGDGIINLPFLVEAQRKGTLILELCDGHQKPVQPDVNQKPVPFDINVWEKSRHLQNENLVKFLDQFVRDNGFATGVSRFSKIRTAEGVERPLGHEGLVLRLCTDGKLIAPVELAKLVAKLIEGLLKVKPAVPGATFSSADKARRPQPGSPLS